MNSFLAGVVLLGVLVVIHELGHFSVAKLLGVRVEVFSVGFGPALLKVKWGETEYRLSMIPLGGYVRMLGETPWQGVDAGDRTRSFLHQTLWKRVAIVAAGPLSNFVLAVFLLTGAFWGPQKVAEPVAGTVLQGGAAHAAGIRSGDRLIQVGHVSTWTFSEVAQQIRSHPGEAVPVVVQRSGSDGEQQQVHITVTPMVRKAMDPLTGKKKQVGSLGLLHMTSPPQVWVTSGTMAAEAGLQSLDEALQVDGTPVSSIAQLRAALADRMDQSISLRVRRPNQSPTEPSATAQTVIAKESDSQQAANQKQFTELDLVLPKAGPVPTNLQVQQEIRRYAVTAQELQQADLKRQIKQTQALLHSVGKRLHRQRGITFVGDTIQRVQQDSWAERLGLQKGDQIVALAGEATPHAFALQQAFSELPQGIHVLGIITGGALVVAATRLGSPVAKADTGPHPHAQSGLGVVWHQPYRPGVLRKHHVGLAQALGRAVDQTGKLIHSTLTGLRLLVTGQAPVSQLAGPITIFSMAGQAAKQGFTLYIFMMALISINLGLLNVLPIPGLDGGHLFLFMLEAIRGKPLSLKWQRRVLQAGMLLLLVVMGIAVVNDVSRLLQPMG